MKFNCMSAGTFAGSIIYTEDGLLLYTNESMVRTLNVQTNPLYVSAFIEHNPIAVYLYGRLVDDFMNDYLRATTLYRDAANNGVLAAAYNLGMCYLQGDGVPKSPADAVKWFEMAANAGHPNSQFKLGMLYDMGDIVPYNPSKASYYYELAAQSNHPIAQRNIGYDYYNGEGVARDMQKGTFWYKCAAENGDDSSQGWCRSHGVSYQEPEELAKIIASTYAGMIN